MARQRLTRKLAEQGKKASPPPQMPAVDRTEGAASPAYYPDPEADKYENGDTSSWAEDPHSPMDPESPPPAMPGNLTTEDLTHPATSDFQKKPETPEEALAQGGSEGAPKQASLKELAERRATLCVRLASAMMPRASALEVEERAVKLMDLDDSKLKAAMETFSVFAGEEQDEFDRGEESEGTKLYDEEEGDDMDADKTASHDITARLDRVEDALGRIINAMGHFFGMEEEEEEEEEEEMSDDELMAYLMAEDMDGDGIDQNEPDYGYSDKGAMHEDDDMMAMEEEEEEMDEEAMLRAMLEEMDEEMSMTASAVEDATEELAKGDDIQSGEGGNTKPDEYAKTPVVAQSDGSDKTATEDPVENNIEITAGDDPMGLMEATASADDDLMALYADLDLAKTAGEEEEVEEEVEMEEDMGDEDEGKQASVKQRPQPKAASAGVQRLGTVPGMPKAAHDEVAELSKIWETAPDVSSEFGLPSSK